MEDVTKPEFLEVKIRCDGKVVWVNADGVCRLRACQIGNLILEDDRNPAEDQDFKMTFPLEDLIECLKRFPQGSVVSLPDSESPNGVKVYTPNSYIGESCFDVFQVALPNWSNPDPVVESTVEGESDAIPIEGRSD